MFPQELSKEVGKSGDSVGDGRVSLELCTSILFLASQKLRFEFADQGELAFLHMLLESRRRRWEKCKNKQSLTYRTVTECACGENVSSCNVKGAVMYTLINVSSVCSYSLMRELSCLLSCSRPWFSAAIPALMCSSAASYSSKAQGWAKIRVKKVSANLATYPC